jgi:glycosyl transferase family 92
MDTGNPPQLSPPDAWEAFIAHAARARARPGFDEEERDYKLELAKRLVEVMKAARQGADLGKEVSGALDAFVDVFDSRMYSLTAPGDNERLRGWAAAHPESLRAAMRAFLDPGLSPRERLESLAAEAAAVHRHAGLVLPPASVLAIGSLLNFAVDPAELPIMRKKLLDRLEPILGEPPAKGPVPEQYAHHLAFAGRVQERLRAAGVEVRDMVDTQSLIFSGALEHEFWAFEQPDSRGAREPKQFQLAACAIYRNEAPYLREWVAFHRLMGVERFYLYDNQSSDDHREALAPYIEEGIVVPHDWPEQPGQLSAYDHCLQHYGPQCRWIAFLDLDEFLFSPSGRSLPDVLADYEQWPAVAVNRANFTTSGHDTPPPGNVIENYLRRIDGGANRYVKSIVDPDEAVHSLGPHHFLYRFRAAVDEAGFPVRGVRTKSVSFSKLRVNHYYTRSREEFRRKRSREAADTGALRPWHEAAVRIGEQGLGIPDDTITTFAPQLRRELERVS